MGFFFTETRSNRNSINNNNNEKKKKKKHNTKRRTQMEHRIVILNAEYVQELALDSAFWQAAVQLNSLFVEPYIFK